MSHGEHTLFLGVQIFKVTMRSWCTDFYLANYESWCTDIWGTMSHGVQIFREL